MIKEGHVYRRRLFNEFIYAEFYLALKDDELNLYKKKGDTPTLTILLGDDFYLTDITEKKHHHLFTFSVVLGAELNTKRFSSPTLRAGSESELSMTTSVSSSVSHHSRSRSVQAKDLVLNTLKSYTPIYKRSLSNTNLSNTSTPPKDIPAIITTSHEPSVTISSADKKMVFEFGLKTREEAEEWIEAILQQKKDMKEKMNDTLSRGIHHTPAPMKKLLKEVDVYDVESSPLLHRPDASRLTLYGLDEKAAKQMRFQLCTVQDGITIYRDRTDSFLRNYPQFVNDILYESTVCGFLMWAVVAFKGHIWLAIFSGVVSALALAYGKVQVRAQPCNPTLMGVQLCRGTTEEIKAIITSVTMMPAWMPAVDSAELIETVDEFCDVIHVTLKPVLYFPLFARPRDLVLLRYWRREDDGSHLVLFSSTVNNKCPPIKGVIRARIPMMMTTIAPKKPEVMAVKSGPTISQVTLALCYNPGGMSSFLSTYLQRIDVYLPFLKSLICLRDETLLMDFVNPKMTMEQPLDEAAVTSQTGVDSNGMVIGVSKLACSSPQKYWAEPDASGFAVRGPNYLNDREKIVAGPAMFHAVALDVLTFEDPAHRYNLAYRPDNIIYQLNKDQDPSTVPFTLIINICIPSPDNQCVVCYYQPADPKWRESTSACVKLFKEFMEADDTFRNNRFKLIPKIVNGNFFIRKAVPARPALIGNKGLKMNYAQGKNWFEVDFDVASDPTARNITGLVMGAVKSLTVDMAFLLESQSEDELPESILGTLRFNQMDLSVNRFIPASHPTRDSTGEM